MLILYFRFSKAYASSVFTSKKSGMQACCFTVIFAPWDIFLSIKAISVYISPHPKELFILYQFPHSQLLLHPEHLFFPKNACKECSIWLYDHTCFKIEEIFSMPCQSYWFYSSDPSFSKEHSLSFQSSVKEQVLTCLLAAKSEGKTTLDNRKSFSGN